MDAQKLRALQIEPEAKARSQRSLWTIFLTVGLITCVAVYFAWLRKGGERRIVDTGVKQPGAARASASEHSASPTPQPSNSGTSRAVEGAVLTVSGYIIARERIEISPRFLGMVKWIGVKKGDAVTNGQVVVLLDDAEQQARMLEAEGALANAKAGLEKAQIDYGRIQKLIADRVEPPQTQDDARIRLESAQARIKEAEGALALARTYLDWTIIRSPINGVVLEKLVDANELVTPQSFGGTRGPSTALIAVADPKDLQVEIDLNESDLPKVFLNQKCRVSPEAYPDRGYDGYVAEIAPEANRQKGTLQVKVQIREPDKYLTPELSARVDFLGKSP